MRFGFGILVLSVCGPGMSAATELRGTISDAQSGKPVAGAVAVLSGAGLRDTTGADGRYELVGNSSGVLRTGRSAAFLDRGSLVLSLDRPGPVAVEVFDPEGKRLASFRRERMGAGEQRIPLFEARRATGLLLARARFDGREVAFHLPPGSGETRSAVVAARAAAVVDTLKVAASGYVTKSVPVPEWGVALDVSLDALAVCNPADKLPNAVNVDISWRGAPLTGAHKVVVETDPTLSGRTIYRPSDLGPGKDYPILVWGNGACSKNGTDHSDFWGEIASHGYIVINEGSPNGSGAYDMNTGMDALGTYLIKAAEWAIEQNEKPCSRFYKSLDTAKVGAFGYSCGGLMAYGASINSKRVKASIMMNSGMLGRDLPALNKLHAPTAYVCGGSTDIAYGNAERDFNDLEHLPTVFANVPAVGHNGTYADDNGGEFGKFVVAWFNWWLKDDTGATGRLKFVGSTKAFNSGAWSTMRDKKLP